MGRRGEGVRRIEAESGAMVRVLSARGSCVLAGSASARSKAAELISAVALLKRRGRAWTLRGRAVSSDEKGQPGLEPFCVENMKEERTQHLVRQARLRLLDRARAGGPRAQLLPGGLSAVLVRRRRGVPAGCRRWRTGKPPGLRLAARQFGALQLSEDMSNEELTGLWGKGRGEEEEQ